jgi:HK97 family phage portal protein
MSFKGRLSYLAAAFSLKAGSAVERNRPPLPTGQVSLSGGWYGRLFARQLPGTSYDYISEVGDPTMNSIVAAALRFIGDCVKATRPRVVRVDKDGKSTPIEDHPLTLLFQTPNPDYGMGLLLTQALRDMLAGCGSLNYGGDGYIAKARDSIIPGKGEVKELHWIPARFVTPEGASGTMVDEYVYRPGPGTKRYLPTEIIRFREIIDTEDMRRGRARLFPAAREIAVDNSAGNYQGGMFRNGGVPQTILSPKEEAVPFSPGEEGEREKARLKQRYKEETTGDNAGSPLVVEFPLDVRQLAFDPKSMDLSAARNTPEERVCAVTGIAPIVLHLGAGLEAATYSNYDQAVQSTMDFGVIPILRFLEEELTRQLLPDFYPGRKVPPDVRVEFDLSRLPSLQDDRGDEAERLDRLATAAARLIAAGYDPEEVREALGLPDMAFVGAPAGAVQPAPNPPKPAGGAPGGKKGAGFRY